MFHSPKFVYTPKLKYAYSDYRSHWYVFIFQHLLSLSWTNSPSQTETAKVAFREIKDNNYRISIKSAVLFLNALFDSYIGLYPYLVA